MLLGSKDDAPDLFPVATVSGSVKKRPRGHIEQMLWREPWRKQRELWPDSDLNDRS